MHFNTWETSEDILFRADQMNFEISRSAPLPTNLRQNHPNYG